MTPATTANGASARVLTGAGTVWLVAVTEPGYPVPNLSDSGSSVVGMSDLRSAVERVIPGVLEDLAALVAIPSISSEPEHHQDVQATAQAVAELFTGAGAAQTRVVSEGGMPAVIAHFPGPQGSPTVCLYAHHDVQPTGDPALWATDPLTVSRRGDRLYARGVVDDKAGIAVHLAALRALQGRLGVGVTVFVEGEEEVGSPSMGRILAAHRDALAADAFVIMDSANWAVGAPAFTASLRGLADVVVEVRTLDHALHSGQYGGVAPDALTTLVQLLATLHDANGDVAVAGLATDEVADLDYPLSRLREEAGMLDGVQFVGTGSVVERLWGRPAITVLAIDATPVALASNTLAPVARAKVSLRLAPTQDADAALRVLKQHLLDHAPFGAQVSFADTTAAGGSVVDHDTDRARAYAAAIEQAWGVPPVSMGMGGSIPLIAEFQQAYPDADMVVVGVCDPDSRMHGIDESLHLGDFTAACVAEALWLESLGADTRPSAVSDQ